MSLFAKKNSLFGKWSVFAILTLFAYSIFAFVLPDTLNKNSNMFSIEENTTFTSHPLSGISDNVVFCSIDGREMHEIFLCGSSDERVLTTNITNLSQIVWSRLQPGSCTSAVENCANTAPGCIWDQLSTNPQYNLTEEGEYRITVRYTDNSTQRFYFNAYASGLNPTAVVTNVDCGAPGSISVNNVPSNYEFSIDNGATWQNSNVFPIATVGNYDISTRRQDDTVGCTFWVRDIEVRNNAIDATTTVSPINCNNAKGSIEVNIADAHSSYIYTIGQGGNLINSSGPISQASYTFENLNSGTYEIEVTPSGASTCSWVGTETISDFNGIQASVLVSKNIDCTEGAIAVSVDGGEAPFEYSLDRGTSFSPFAQGNSVTIPITDSGDYTIRVRDGNGCEVDANAVNVIQEPEIVYTITPEDNSCNGINDGSITINVTDTQAASITYSMDNGTSFQTYPIFENLDSGTYNIVIRKEKAGGSCDLVHGEVILSSAETFIAEATITQEISCTSGSATLLAAVTSGGNAPFTYSINGTDYQSDPEFTNLGSGDYTVLVRDSSGCIAEVDQIVQPNASASNLNFGVVQVDCATGTSDIQVIPEGGTGPFTFNIISPITLSSATDTFENLAPDIYTFEVTSDDGCITTRNYTVTDPFGLTASTTLKKNVGCSDGSDGIVELFVDGFNGSYDLVVQDASGTDTGLGASNLSTNFHEVNGLSVGTFTFLVSDGGAACPNPVSVTMDAPPAPLVVDSFSIAPISCGTPGSVTIEASGGWGNYTYAVEQPDGAVTAFQSNKKVGGLLQEGTHTIQLRDINGCVVSDTTFELMDQGSPTAMVDQATSQYCYSPTAPASLKIDVSGGEAPYFYSLNNGSPQPITGGSFTLTDLGPDDYEIRVIGNNSCETLVADTEINGVLTAFANMTTPLGCSGVEASVEITAQGGYPDPDYTYEVSRDGGSFTAATLPFTTDQEGSLVFRITDSKGCMSDTPPVEITAPIPPTATEQVNGLACAVEGTGSIAIETQNGTPPFTYSVDGGAFVDNNLFTDLDSGDHTYTVRDALNCEYTAPFTVTEGSGGISAEVELVKDITCDISGGTSPGVLRIFNFQNTSGTVDIRTLRIRSLADYEATGWALTENRFKDDLSVSPSTSTNQGKLNLPVNYIVRVTDSNTGCQWESDPILVTQPPLPFAQTNRADVSNCGDGATFEIEVQGNPTDLVGPFEASFSPRHPTAASNVFAFNDSSVNEAHGEDTDSGIHERDLRVSGLAFGVVYWLNVTDTNTGCQRRIRLGQVATPTDAPGFAINVRRRAMSCRASNDGEAQIRIANAGDDNGDGIQEVQYRIYNQNNPDAVPDQYSGTATAAAGENVIINLSGLRWVRYAVEVTSERGCTIGESFLIQRPSHLLIEPTLVTSARCGEGAQISVRAQGGWLGERGYGLNNNFGIPFRPGQYAFVLSSVTDPTTIPESEWQESRTKEVAPTAFDGVNNEYTVYVRDVLGCTRRLADPILITQDPVPEIDEIVVGDRCTSTDETYPITVNMLNTGTNPSAGAPLYIWDGEVTTSATKIVGPGAHTLEVRDENGCIATEDFFIYPQIVPQVSVSKTLDCDPAQPNNGAILASAYGGSGTYSYTISPIPADYGSGEETNTTGMFDRLEAGVDFVVTITDIDPDVLPAERCPSVDTRPVRLEVPSTPDFIQILALEQGVSCRGGSDGVIVIGQSPSATNLDTPYEYSISPGSTYNEGSGSPYQSSAEFNGLSAGLYSVRVRSAKNCLQDIGSMSIDEPAELQFNAPSVSAFTCGSGNAFGTITVDVSATGGTAPYLFSFDGAGYDTATSGAFLPTVTARTITIDVQDSNGCTTQTTATIPAVTKVSVDLAEVQIMDCTTDAEIRIEASNGSGNYELLELPSENPISGSSDQWDITIPSGLTGTHTYRLVDLDTGCADEVTYTIPAFETLEVTGAKDKDITCAVDTDGAISFVFSGTYTGAYSYDLYDSETPTTSLQGGTEDTASGELLLENLGVGTYFLVVTQDNHPGCTSESNFITIQSPSEPLDFDYALTQDLSCDPGNDAQVQVNAFGGWGNYEFKLVDLSNPGTPIQDFGPNSIFTRLTSGITYEITVRDARGCDNIIKTIEIPAIDPIVIDPANVSFTDPSCPETADGSLSVTVSRTNGPTDYLYSLTNVGTGAGSVPQSTNIFTDLPQGTYTITVSDTRGCRDTTDPITLADPEEVRIDAEITETPNCLPNTAEITLSATGGTGSYEYKMIAPVDSGWQTNNVFPDLGAETYEFIARDADPTRLCESPISVIRTINVVEPLALIVDDSSTIINCNGETNAVLVAEAFGGLGGYQYQLERNGSLEGTPQDSGIFDNLGAGSYRIYSTGGANCEVYSDTISITEPDQLEATLENQEGVQCFGQTNGSASVTAIGGTPPYTYTISSEPLRAVDTNLFEGLDMGDYIITVQDANGCYQEVPITIEGPLNPLGVDIIRVEHEVCSDDDNGVIELRLRGGTPPYEYSLESNSGSFAPIANPSAFVLDNLDSGFYFVFIRDANGCEVNTSQEIRVGVDLTASYETIYECRDGQPHSATTVTLADETISPTDVMYSLNTDDISSAQASPIFENMPAGEDNYIVVHHVGGCIEVMGNIAIEAQDPLILTQKRGNVNEILVEASGGSGGGYTYSLNNEENRTGSFYIYENGSYTVNVTDSEGCEASMSFEMEFFDILIPNVFTPNGDGIRDTWAIKNWEAHPNIYVSIFDRFGRELHSFIGAGEWDGTYNNGSLPAGDYWYIIRLNGLKDPREFIGHMTIYR